MAIHKNYIEGFGRNRNDLINDKILPHQNEIFHLFCIKFSSDAEQDRKKSRMYLSNRGRICANLCNNIHSILGGTIVEDPELKALINDIVNLDYQSLHDFFDTLRTKYSSNFSIETNIAAICQCLEKMRQISKPHTTIKSKD